MSFCSYCGSQINDGSKFCPSCGAQLPQQASEPQQAPQYVPQNTPQYTYSQPQPQIPAQMSKKEKTNAMGGWFKFLIYFALFLGAIMNIGYAAQMLSGQPYDGRQELVYAFIPKLKSADTFYVILCFVLAALAIVVRFRLAGFKKDGLYLLYGLYGINLIGSIIYIALQRSAIKDSGLSIDYSSAIVSLVISAIFIVINVIYFQKRKQYFN